MFMIRIIVIIVLILAAIPLINKLEDYLGSKKEKIAKELDLKNIKRDAENLLSHGNKDKKIAQEGE